jgi:hypothetical protein
MQTLKNHTMKRLKQIGLARKLASFPILILMLGLLQGCAEKVTSDACSWLRQIHPDAGFETRWTRAEKEQVETLDEAIEKKCRSMPL